MWFRLLCGGFVRAGIEELETVLIDAMTRSRNVIRFASVLFPVRWHSIAAQAADVGGDGRGHGGGLLIGSPLDRAYFASLSTHSFQNFSFSKPCSNTP